MKTIPKKPVFIVAYALLVMVMPSLYDLSQWVLTDLLDKITFWRELPMFVLPFVYFWLFRDERPRLTLFPILGFALICVVGTLHLAAALITPIILIRGLIAYFLVFWSLWFFRSIKTSSLMLFALGSTALCLVGGIGVIVDQQFQIFRYVVNFGSVEERLASFSTEGYRPSFLFEAATMGSFILAVATGLQFYVVRYFANKTVTLVCIVSVVASITAIVLSLARVGYGGLSIMIAGFACATILAGHVRYLIGAAALGAVALVVVIVCNNDTSDLALRFERTFTGEATYDESNTERLYAWQDGYAALEKNALFGAGIGTGQVRAVQEAPRHYENSLLAVFNEGGIVAMVLFCTVLFAPLVRLLRRLRSSQARDVTVFSIFFMLSLFAMSFINPIFSLPDYSIYLGFIYSLMERVAAGRTFDGRAATGPTPPAVLSGDAGQPSLAADLTGAVPS